MTIAVIFGGLGLVLLILDSLDGRLGLIGLWSIPCWAIQASMTVGSMLCHKVSELRADIRLMQSDRPLHLTDR